jgi:membrane-bound lytic murein transglycosylase D
MNKKGYRKGTALCGLVILLALWGGCSGIFRNTSGTLDESYSLDVDTILELESFEQLRLLPPSCAEVHVLVERAKEYIEEEFYDQAHEELLNAIYIIQQEQVVSGTYRMPQFDEYIEEIIGLYTLTMPLAYADSVPEYIAMQVFENQLNRALDSLELGEQDSIARMMITCQRGVSFDIPLVWNDRVARTLSFFLRARNRSIEKWLRRGEYYIPFMRELIARHGLPTDLVYLPIIESGFNPKAYSYAHASGIWQFIVSTGRRYNLRTSYWLDERRDPIKSTIAAIEYFSELYEMFDDWYLALAAYNCGENGVQRAIKRAGSNDFWDLRLPRQTMHYVPKYLSALLIAKNPSCFGFQQESTDTVVPFSVDTVKISDCVDLYKIASGIDIELDTLKRLNPHILRWCTPPDVEDVTLYLPQGTREKYTAFYAQLTDKDKVRWYRYRIQRGDNLSMISRRFKTSVSAVKSINNLRSTRIIAGRYLLIPIPASGGASAKGTAAAAAADVSKSVSRTSADTRSKKAVSYRLKRGDTLWELADLFDVTIEQLCRWNNITDPTRMSAGDILTVYLPRSSKPQVAAVSDGEKGVQRSDSEYNHYSVKRGDNLYSIARRLDITVAQLRTWNPQVGNGTLIRPGDIIKYYQRSPSTGSVGYTAAAQPSGRAASVDTVYYKVEPGDNLSMLAELFSSRVHTIMHLNSIAHPSALRAGDVLRIPVTRRVSPGMSASNRRIVYYKVRKGDNLWNIAQLFNTSLDNIYKLNGLSERSKLMPGDTVRVLLAEEL